jgi:hypothetical protein
MTGRCAFDDNAASAACHRCGTFYCDGCARRTRPDATPMCKNCWESRAKAVSVNGTHSETRLQTAGLVLGSFALLPIPALQLASLVVNLLGFFRAKEGESRRLRWKNTLGLALTGVGILIFVVLLVFATNFGP